MKIVEFYEENGPSRSRNFSQAGARAGATKKWTGSATLLFTLNTKRLISGSCLEKDTGKLLSVREAVFNYT
jgi:hypothetical protein